MKILDYKIGKSESVMMRIDDSFIGADLLDEEREFILDIFESPRINKCVIKTREVFIVILTIPLSYAYLKVLFSYTTEEIAKDIDRLYKYINFRNVS